MYVWTKVAPRYLTSLEGAFYFLKEASMLQNVRGTYDIIGTDYDKVTYVHDIFSHFMKLYDYKMIKTPIIEDTAVFKKEDDTSDMVTKEMFTFSINGKDSLTLRPEGTAGVIRSVIQHKLYANEMPLKLAYSGEMFRYERPQKGRQRQFNQLGVEVIGDKSPMIDAEVIAMGYYFLKTLGIKDIEVQVNTLGDRASRKAYLAALKDYFKPYIDELCHDCKERLAKNPLRILDCKIDSDKTFMRDVPNIKDFLSQEARDYYDAVLAYLDKLGIPYRENSKMVRGLDYYTDTVFEVVSTAEETGSQSTIFGGGRYDQLVAEMGGPDLSGIGFAIGQERLIIAMESAGLFDDLGSKPDVYIIDLSEGNPYVLEVAELLRNNAYSVSTNYYKRSLKAQFRSADRQGARFVVIIGEDEVAAKTINIKDQTTKDQKTIKLEELIDYLDANIGGQDE